MSFPETVAAAVITYLLMIAAVKFRHIRPLHIGGMSTVILFDLLFPFYLYATRNWKERLIDSGEILNFLVWMHFGLIITLYVLYYLQIQAGRSLVKNEYGDGDRSSVLVAHQSQGKGILLTRLLVILTGWLLYEPSDDGNI